MELKTRINCIDFEVPVSISDQLLMLKVLNLGNLRTKEMERIVIITRLQNL